MSGTNTIVHSSVIEVAIAKMYIFLLPIRMISPLLGIAALFHGAGLYFDFFLNCFGILIYLLHSDGKIYFNSDIATKAIKIFTVSVLALNIMSIIMAIETQVTQGNYAGETAFSGIIGMEIYFFQYIFIVVYNRRVFNILSQQQIWNILSRCCTFLLVLGYYQMAVLKFGGVFRYFLNKIDIFRVLWPEANMWKLSLTGKEGADAGIIFGVLVLPYLLTCISMGINKLKSIIQLMLWFPVLIMMQSTSAYLMVIAAFLGYIFYNFGVSLKKKITIITIAGVVIVAIALWGQKIISLLPAELVYSIFGKATDLSNGSTVARLIPFITNFKAFLQHPFLGVGNGLQGYYYVMNVPSWALKVAGSDIGTFYKTAKEQIVNGGIFFPSYISGYGIVGVLLLLNLIKVMKECIRDMKNQRNVFSCLFCISIWAIVVCGFQGEFAGNYLIWFIISLPFISYYYPNMDINQREEEYNG